MVEVALVPELRFDSTIPAASGTSRSKGSTAPGDVHCHLGSQFSRTVVSTFQRTFDWLIPGYNKIVRRWFLLARAPI